MKIIFNEEQVKDICNKYRYENMLETDIGEVYNVSRKVIKRILTENSCIRAYKDAKWLDEQYNINKLNKREIAKLANCNEMSIHKYFNKFELETDDTISRKRKYDYNENFFDCIDSSEKAYWLGFIVADGCIINNASDMKLSVTLCIDDIEHLRKLANEICPDIKISETQTFLKATGKYYNMCGIRFYNRHLINSLMKLGVDERKSLKEVYPIIPEEFDRDFIRGEFDGDGCFSICNGRPHVTMIGSEELINSVRDKLIKHLGIDAKIRRDKKLFVITYTSSKAEKFMNWIYENKDICLDRKYDKYVKYISGKI